MHIYIYTLWNVVRPKYPGPGLDTKIPKSGLKIYPKILQKMSKNPNFISKNLEMYSKNPDFFLEIIK